MIVYKSLLLSNTELYFNILTILLSFLAVVYWTRLFKHFNLSGKENIGWVWIFVSVLMILLLNLSDLPMMFSSANMNLGLYQSFRVNVSTFSMIGSVSRTLIAVSITVGGYLLYSRMGDSKVKYKFMLVESANDEEGLGEAKYKVNPGSSHIIEESSPESISALELFSDLVKHGIHGLCITRNYPPKIRDKYNLLKTPIIWLTREKGYDDSIEPTSMIGLSQTIKEFVSTTDDGIVLLDGVEYLIMHNKFEDVIRMIQSVKDVVVQHDSRLVVSIDPSALDEKQVHLLKRELKEYGLQ
ncbi:MAG: DUF835 domain-containing protein [Candidatus Altiarchaeota archaeon]